MLGEESTELIRSHRAVLQTMRRSVMFPLEQESKQCKVVLKRDCPVAFGAGALVTSARIRGKLTHIVALI